jgi:hypothetical protein
MLKDRHKGKKWGWPKESSYPYTQTSAREYMCSIPFSIEMSQSGRVESQSYSREVYLYERHTFQIRSLKAFPLFFTFIYCRYRSNVDKMKICMRLKKCLKIIISFGLKRGLSPNFLQLPLSFSWDYPKQQ